MKVLILLVLGVISTSADRDAELLKDIAVGGIQFTSNVYRSLLKFHDGNFVVCPISTQIILGLAHNGAGGDTAQQLAESFQFPNDKENIQTRIKLVLPFLNEDHDYKISSANKIYVQDGHKINDQFKSTAVNVFQSDIQSINFKNNQQAAADMNKWVEEKTKNTIKNLISKDSLSEDTRSVLINAISFNGKWVNSFPTPATVSMPFYALKNKKTQVDLMQQLNEIKYFESKELKAKFVQLPYEGNGVSMTIALPVDQDGLSALETKIYEVLGENNINYSEELVELKIPKFQMKSTIDFKSIMEELGAIEAFTDGANFGGILVNQPLKISKVTQKAYIEVEEEGTKASAATAVEMAIPDSLDYIPPKVTKFIADHPFVYFIKINGLIVFAGRYTGV